MRRSRPILLRNKIDFTEPSQVRALSKRLGVSREEVEAAIAKVGSSISAVTKEVESEMRRSKPVLRPTP